MMESTPTTNIDEVLALLRDFKDRRKAEYDLTLLGVFGSYARGTAGPHSDVDVVYKTNSPNLFKTVRMQLELQKLLSRNVDIIHLREHMNPRLKRRIIQDAIYV